MKHGMTCFFHTLTPVVSFWKASAADNTEREQSA